MKLNSEAYQNKEISNVLSIGLILWTLIYLISNAGIAICNAITAPLIFIGILTVMMCLTLGIEKCNTYTEAANKAQEDCSYFTSKVFSVNNGNFVQTTAIRHFKFLSAKEDGVFRYILGAYKGKFRRVGSKIKYNPVIIISIILLSSSIPKRTFKPESIATCKKLFSEDPELVQKMLRSSNIIDVAVATIIIEGAGVNV